MKLRRAQPWLGTLVEIEVSHRSRHLLLQALEAAFAAIARVHGLMSRQLAGSDVARLNQAPAGKRVSVHPWTARTLTQALRWQRLSDSAFDIVEPDRPGRHCSAAPLRVFNDGARTGATVIKQRDCRISLDGIAKGFAIDQAVRVLRGHQVRAGLVIAGGDLRCFGARSFRVTLRRPDAAAPAPAWQLQIRECALATSGRYFGGALWNTASNAHASWTVMARTATAADALTKVVYGMRADRARLLRQCTARAWYVEPRDHSFVCVEL